MRSFYKFLSVVIIIAIGLAIFQGLVKSKPQAKRRPVSIAAPVVEFITTRSTPQRITVHATGTVLPQQEVVLLPQVSGVVVWQNPDLVPGSRIAAGAALVRIDPRDYELAVSQQRASLTRAQVELETERGRSAVAEREWDLLGDEMEASAAGRDLALRKPQLKNAEAAWQAARSAFHKAELDLERTMIRAPFNALVLSEHVDLGQLLTPGTTIARLAGSDAFRVQAAVLPDELKWIDIPGTGASAIDFPGEGASGSVNSTKVDPGMTIPEMPTKATSINETAAAVPSVAGTAVPGPSIPGTVAGIKSLQMTSATGPRVRIITRSGAMAGNHVGTVARLLVDVDPKGRMARLLINVPRPLAGAEPLLLGSYVSLEIEGRRLEGTFALPSQVLREGDRVWLLADDDTLVIRAVEVVRRQRAVVLVRGLRDGERLITTRIASPVSGMRLRPEVKP